MDRRSTLRAFTMMAFGLSWPPQIANAQLAKDIVGTWTIVSADAYGAAPKGTFMLDANGRFSLILMRPDLPKYASNNRTQGTPPEYRATVEGSLAYFGTYVLNGTDMTLRVEGSTFPNWIGTDQKRNNVTVVGDELKYNNPAPSGGGGLAPLVWKRVK